MNDTIVAISTALGIGAISIIRVSGEEALNIVNKITKSKKILTYPTHTIHYDFIMEKDVVIDEVLISIMKAPKTFTREDIVEINCHGGIATTNKVLELLLVNGCRLAEPGEFTKRAFLNGRIDLIEAEGIMDLINAKTDKSRTLALQQVSGQVSNLISNLRQKLLEILANIAVNIDYPEYDDIEEITLPKIAFEMNEIEKEVIDILDKSKNGKMIKDGLDVAIIGQPNVGKSSLLNALLGYDKAIVTDIAGTTRDFVEGKIMIDGIVLNMIDTAGIRKTDDVVEKIGVDKSKDVMKNVDLVLYLLNNNEIMSAEEEDMLNELVSLKHIVVINKVDLENKLDLNKIKNHDYVYTSTLNNEGIDDLRNKIKELFHLEQLELADYTYVTNARVLALLSEVLERVKDVRIGIENNKTIDMIEIDLKYIWSLLGNIIGQTYEDELIDQLFSQFCLGK